MLEHNSDIARSVKHPAAVDCEPNADMDRMAGLAHQHGIALARALDGPPALPFGVIAEAGEHGAQICGVDRDLRHL